MTDSLIDQVAGFVRLLRSHRGEPADSYDRVAQGYDLFAPTWDRVVHRRAMGRYEALLAKRIPAGGAVLDAGAGTGERTLAILRQSEPGSVVALDASSKMLEVARTKIKDPRVEFLVGDVTRLPFQDSAFDVVSCTWVLSILDEPHRAVTEFLRVLKPGGTVMYAFCSLPQGPIGSIAAWIVRQLAPESSPVSHLLPPKAQPFHDCAFSSLERFSGGLATVVALGKCCSVTEPALPCALEVDLAGDGDTVAGLSAPS